MNGTATNVNPSSSTTAGATPTSQSPAPATSTGSHGGSSHTGPIVGGVVGGIAGLVLITTAAWFFWRRRGARRDFGTKPMTENPFPVQEIPEPMKERDGPVSTVEAPDYGQLHEIDTTRTKLRPAELQ